MNCIEAIKWMKESPDNIAISPSGYQFKMDIAQNFRRNIGTKKNRRWVYQNGIILISDILGEWKKDGE